jgi:tetratricopeptide (TPR) repeat protein
MTAPTGDSPLDDPPGGGELDRPMLALLLAYQRRGWRRGDRVAVEDCLAQHPGMAADAEAVLDLIYQEVLFRKQAGESPRLEEYLRRFPHLGPQLELQFDLEGALGPMTRVQSPAHVTLGPGSRPARVAEVLPSVPGYEVLGVLGRGGMGVVYKVLQLRLNRVAALKMILAGDHAGPEAAVRFLGEAEAIARLNHPHIVQIFTCGDHDGRPYIEMECVDGGSLADRLDGTPWPARDAAALIETVARAIHEAHRLGIVHRDLKPANILLTADGTPKVADFGLAKWVGVETGLTRTSWVVGSPSYMAPEQAQGKAGVVGPAADVYSLGAVLYELLTGRPPFKAATMLETLAQVKSAEPVSPTRLQPNLPRDLVTVCLKCLEKEPPRRYATAVDLAEDLRRFAAGEVILARPAGAARRGWRWCRREPAWAALAATLAVGFVGVATQWWRAERHLRLEIAAHRALREARDREQEASRREEEARRRAHERFLLGMKAIGGYSTLAGQDELLKDPELEGLRKKLLGTALEFYTELQSSLEADPAPQARSPLAEAYCRLGYLRAEVGPKAEALAAYRRALAIWEELVAADPENVTSRAGLAETQTMIGIQSRAGGRRDEAFRAFERAISTARGLVRDHPAVAHYRGDLAWCLNNLGAIQAESGRPDEAIRSQAEALAIREALARESPADFQCRADLAWCLNDLGGAMYAAGRSADALATHRRALAICEGLTATGPAAHPDRSGLVRSQLAVGFLLRKTGRGAEAMRVFEPGLAVARALVRDHPTVALYRTQLADCLYNMGIIQADGGRRDESVRSQEEALAIREALARGDPDDPERQSALAWSLEVLGLALDAAGHPDNGLRRVDRAIAALEGLGRDYPTHTEYRERLGDCLEGQGVLRRRIGDPAASGSFEQSLAIREALAGHDPASISYQDALGRGYLQLAVVRAAAGRTDEALVLIRNAERIAERSPDVSPLTLYNLACAYAQCGAGGPAGGRERGAAGRSAGEEYADRAMELLRRAVAAGYANVALIRRDLDLDSLRTRRDFRELLMDLSFPREPFER